MKTDAPGEEQDFRESKEWDSLSHMELVAAIEERWRITLTNEEIVGMRCLADIRRVLRAHGMDGDK